MSKAIVKVWTFPSSSNPNKNYETLKYDDGTTSCGCPGWCRRVAVDGSRSCKHTRLVDQGIANQECISSHDYASTQPAPVQPKIQTPLKMKAKHQVVKPEAVRKIRWQ
jgi:hypothetical protein